MRYLFPGGVSGWAGGLADRVWLSAAPPGPAVDVVAMAFLLSLRVSRSAYVSRSSVTLSLD